MSDYAEIVGQLLNKQYPNIQTDHLVISSLNMKVICPRTQILFQNYRNIKIMVLIRCDLRKLQNFPVFSQLTSLNISQNSLQGSFNYLMPLKKLTYLDISYNYISNWKQLQPLQRLRRVEIYIKGNFLERTQNWKQQKKRMSSFLIYLDKPRQLFGKQVEQLNSSSERQDSQTWREPQFQRIIVKYPWETYLEQKRADLYKLKDHYNRLLGYKKRRTELPNGVIDENSSENQSQLKEDKENVEQEQRKQMTYELERMQQSQNDDSSSVSH